MICLKGMGKNDEAVNFKYAPLGYCKSLLAGSKQSGNTAEELNVHIIWCSSLR